MSFWCFIFTISILLFFCILSSLSNVPSRTPNSYLQYTPIKSKAFSCSLLLKYVLWCFWFFVSRLNFGTFAQIKYLKIAKRSNNNCDLLNSLLTSSINFPSVLNRFEAKKIALDSLTITGAIVFFMAKKRYGSEGADWAVSFLMYKFQSLLSDLLLPSVLNTSWFEGLKNRWVLKMVEKAMIFVRKLGWVKEGGFLPDRLHNVLITV